MLRLSRENILHLRKLWQILFWGNSHSFLINFALYTHLYFHSAFLRMCVFIWAPQKWRPRHDSCVRGLLKKCSGENGSENQSRGSWVGLRKELSKAEASAWSHRGCGGWVKYPRDGCTVLSGNLFFFFPLCQWVIVSDMEERWAGFVVTLRQGEFSSGKGQSMVIMIWWSITWEFVRPVNSQGAPQTYWIRNSGNGVQNSEVH